jgi:threonine/homoserine/homoserine lactone efflux protein
MNLTLFLRGLLIGFSIAAPVGPIGVLCIRRTLAEGRAAGFVSGLGAATADAFYGCIAAFGLTAVSSLLVGQSLWLRLIGGAFLCYLGLRTFLARPASEAAQVSNRSGLLGAYASTLLLTLTNPATILSFVAVFAGIGVASGDWGEAATTVVGVFTGSALWWLTLSGGVGLLHDKVRPGAMGWVNRLSGVVIASFGLIAILSLAQ